RVPVSRAAAVSTFLAETGPCTFTTSRITPLTKRASSSFEKRFKSNPRLKTSLSEATGLMRSRQAKRRRRFHELAHAHARICRQGGGGDGEVGVLGGGGGVGGGGVEGGAEGMMIPRPGREPVSGGEKPPPVDAAEALVPPHQGPRRLSSQVSSSPPNP